MYTLYKNGKWVLTGELKDCEDFINKEKNQNDKLSTWLKQLTGKVVKFKYSGGSHYGHRVVTVTKAQKTHNNSYVIEGRDASEHPDNNYRRYVSESIRGEIEVLT